MNAQPSSATTVLDVANLTVRIDGQLLLSDVSFAVGRGTLHGVVGPNGAGKSTLLQAILGQLAFDGRIVAHWRRGGRIGYVPQGFAVDRTLPVTVADFLALTRQKRPVCFGVSRLAARRVSAMLERVGLAGFEQRQLSVLSGGELRRVLLAHALDPLPELLILDEPATGLDASAALWLGEVLTQAQDRDGVTILMVSHDLASIRRDADHVTVLDKRVVADGTPMETIE
jgi:zinc transport system ATP-binding protein